MDKTITIYEKTTKKVIAIISDNKIILNMDYDVGYNDDYVGNGNEIFYKEFSMIKGGKNDE